MIVFINHVRIDLLNVFAEHLKQRQHDSDESVRMDVVQAIVGAAKKELRNVSDDLLECVKERTLDKKVVHSGFSILQIFLNHKS